MKKHSEQALAELGARIRQTRLARGYSQDELADLCGMHRTYIGSVERGERNFSVLNLLKIVKALDVSVNALFGDEKPSD
ncbi:helix-turn-helix domain-containing protein [Marinobacter litoralis]|uniref:helix-turn-helix domain-containing protein n=1 Tax=Marinobacter litoralis TaxID=187981 RepID=UPI000DF4A2DE|nr:helix-turn-helix transcriptional regulator [Marinobacter litoralis]